MSSSRCIECRLWPITYTLFLRLVTYKHMLFCKEDLFPYRHLTFRYIWIFRNNIYGYDFTLICTYSAIISHLYTNIIIAKSIM
ncbi:hypothetical protein MSL71_220 [Desulfoluna butyratoxydans]|uniref:Uncharacterized protein n=1 Tax=Desulfoluna butyratoxydans TaxID=231438 RepID=A0A4U8YGZ8_9BACT|nr:hypothetical protein MSL71_220 [Desulfoluna butyratoxydans]